MNAAQRRTSSSSGSSQSGSPASSPVFTTSAMPFEALRLGQRLEQRRIDHGPRRPVEGADEVLALRQVDRRLAADRGVDLGDEARRDRHPRDAAEVGRGRESGRVGRAAAAERDDRPAPVEAQVLPEAVERGERLRLLAGRELVRLREARAERELRVHAVDAGDVRVGDERDRPVAGNELAEPLQRAALDVHAGGGEHDVVDVPGDDVGDLGVQRRVARSYSRRNAASSCASGRSLPLTRSQQVSTSTSSQIVSVSPSASRTAGEVTAPPPSASTIVCSSSARKAASPSVAEDLRDRLARRRTRRGRRRRCRRARGRRWTCPRP